MQVLVLWKKTLEFFEAKNLSQMGLLTLKTVAINSKAIWLFMLGSSLIKVVFQVCLGFFFSNELIPWALLIANLSANLVFIYLTLRSSVKRKTWGYYVSYWVPELKLFVALSVLIGSLHYITGYYYWWFFLGPIITWASLFFLDMGPVSGCHFGARCSCLVYGFFRAFKMVFYNLPIYLVLVLCSTTMWMFSFSLEYLLHYLIDYRGIGIGIIVLLPLEAAFYSNLYIKFLHEQFDLYFSSDVQKEV